MNRMKIERQLYNLGNKNILKIASRLINFDIFPCLNDLEIIYYISNNKIDLIKTLIYDYDMFKENYYFKCDLNKSKLNFFSMIIKNYHSNPKFYKEFGYFVWKKLLPNKYKKVYFNELFKKSSSEFIFGDYRSLYAPQILKKRKLNYSSKKIYKVHINNVLKIILNHKDKINKI